MKYTVDWLEVARRKMEFDHTGRKFFRSVIKLDNNFHVYVHGKKELLAVEKDSNGTYLKLYFKQIK